MMVSQRSICGNSAHRFILGRQGCSLCGDFEIQSDRERINLQGDNRAMTTDSEGRVWTPPLRVRKREHILPEIGTFGELPFVFYPRMSPSSGYIRRMAVVSVFRSNTYGLTLSYGFGLQSRTFLCSCL